MQNISNRQAFLLILFIYILTIGAGYLLPGYPITVGGLVVCIFLTVYFPGWRITMIVAGVSVITLLGFLLLHEEELHSAYAIAYNIFKFLLIGVTVLIVGHMKNLYNTMGFDKTHMTSLFENATEGIVLTNGKGEIILVNPSALRTFGYEEFELIGKPIEKLIPSRYRSPHVQLREGFLHNPSNRVMGHGRDLHGAHKSGHDFPVEVSLSHYKQKNESFVIAFIVDITQRKEIEGSIRKQRMTSGN